MADASNDSPEPSPPPRVWPVTVTLKYPFDFGSEHIAALEFKRGKLGDLKGMGLKIEGTPPLDQLLLIASRMCGKPLKVMEMLDSEDAAPVLELALDFFGRCLMGGSQP